MVIPSACLTALTDSNVSIIIKLEAWASLLAIIFARLHSRMINKIKSTYQEFPARFRVVVAASFVDRIGATLIFPFFALYITQKFGVGMTQAGLLIGVYSFSGLIGSTLGGAMADRFGRRFMILFGLVFSALSSMAMGLANDLRLFYVLAVGVGLLSDIAGPAWQAMVADILAIEKRTEGFGILRVTANMAWIIGPTIGGLMAGHSYLLLFIMDATCSIITAAIVYRSIPESMPHAKRESEPEPLIKTIAGYRDVVADRIFMAYILVSVVMLLGYIQMYNTLAVYLRDVRGVPPQGYGILVSISAVTVVLFQFWVTRRVKNYPPMLMMALGSAFYMIGLSSYAFITQYALFAAAIILITIGEMIIMPVSQALAANFAPTDMRGRYMAVFALAWYLPSTFGPLLAGLILDNYNPNLVWYAAGILSLLAGCGFLWLHHTARSHLTTVMVIESQPT
jgi:MFS family permease